MESKWTKAKTALGLNLCVYAPKTLDDSPPPTVSGRFSDVLLPSPSHKSFSGFRLSFRTTKSSLKGICAICLNPMKLGRGHAIFTAECSHAFHFDCITSNVKHGNRVCPVCRAKWKEIPFQNPNSDPKTDRKQTNLSSNEGEEWTVVPVCPPPRTDSNRRMLTAFHPPEPLVFDDDDTLEHLPEISKGNAPRNLKNLVVKTFLEISSVPKSDPHENFTVLIHLKGPASIASRNGFETRANSRPPVDLVTVLDVSGSMAGTKLALLKRAMGFVILNLLPFDRLSVIAFSSVAYRLFPLRKMTDTGRHLALNAVNSLTSSGGTNISEGLNKGSKVMTDRKLKNSVSSIILLSDGRDTYNTTPDFASSPRIPVHTFGFGTDHDSPLMHSIAEASGGTFSSIETEHAIQDAFAQCIGGLLSVAAQKVRVEVECVDPSLKIASLRAGSYETRVEDGSRRGFVEGGDLYAEEERHFLVTVDIPASCHADETSLFSVRCEYLDPITKEIVRWQGDSEVKIRRGLDLGIVSIEVDRQKTRLRSAKAMSEARSLAERGDLEGAVVVLECCRKELSETVSAKSGDRLCMGLDAELREMQGRMSDSHVYEASGRSYVLSGLSSHSWQRATARGDSTSGKSVGKAYQTPSMVDMVNRSRTMFGETRSRIGPTQSFIVGENSR